MSSAILITICVLLLIAYVFDLTSSFTRIPSVILLLLLGWVVRQISEVLPVDMPDLNPLLPIFGTIGLILIVLEGALELELDRSKIWIVVKSILVAFIPMIALSLILAYAFRYFTGEPLKICLSNAVPLCVISSAIAIPTARHLSPADREFVIYESSLSDIAGVLYFNFVTLHDTIDGHSFGHFSLELFIMIIVSFVATIGLSLLLSRFQHQVKFGPIILIIILIYSISKIYHLPGLLFILLFGLFLGNLDELKKFKWIQKLRPDLLDKEVHKFKELTIEATFLVRVLFFLLFGYLMDTREILNTDTLPWAAGVVASIVLIRTVQLFFTRLPLVPLMFIAPRGLITILLFLSIPVEQAIPMVNKSLIIQVIILTALLMMVGMIISKKKTVIPIPDAAELQQ